MERRAGKIAIRIVQPTRQRDPEGYLIARPHIVEVWKPDPLALKTNNHSFRDNLRVLTAPFRQDKA